MKAVGGFLRLLLFNLVLIGLVLYGGLAMLTGKFPPDIDALRSYGADFANVRENYRSLLTRSETYIDKNNADADAPAAAKTGAPPSPQAKEIAEIKMQILHLQSQMNRIEEQNRVLLQSLHK